MKKALSAIFAGLLLVAFAANLYAQEEKIKTVEAHGFGQNSAEARQDALRSALMQVVGAYISSESMVQNFVLIKDNILSYSTGLIEGFSVISEGPRDDVFVSHLNVSVKETQVAGRLKNLNIARVAVPVDREQIVKSIQTSQFNVANIDDLKKTFQEVVVNPILQEKSHSVTFNGLNIYEIREVPQVSGDFVSLNVKNVADQKEQTLQLCRQGIREYNSFSDALNEPSYDRNKTTINDMIDNYYLISINYRVSLSNDYFTRITEFFRAAADKADRGVALANYNDYKDKKIIMASNTSHIANRKIATNIFVFNERRMDAIKNMGGLKLEPYINFALFDDMELPVRAWRHNFKTGSDIKCNSGVDYTLSCSEFSEYARCAETIRGHIAGLLAGLENNHLRRTAFLFGIFYYDYWHPFDYSDNTNYPIAFILNDHIDFTTYIVLPKQDALLIKDVQISLHPNPVN